MSASGTSSCRRPGSTDGPATGRRAVRSSSQRRHAITGWGRENQRQPALTADDIDRALHHAGDLAGLLAESGAKRGPGSIPDATSTSLTTGG